MCEICNEKPIKEFYDEKIHTCGSWECDIVAQESIDQVGAD